MAGVNKVILVGNLGQDPEIRHLEGGTSVATFSIATSENYTDRDGNRQTQTEWHNIVMWRGLATIAEKYLRKGSKIYIEGKLQHRSYEKDGITRYITDIVARDMQMLDSRQEGSSVGGYVPPTASDAPVSTPSTPTASVTATPTPDLSKTEGESKDDLPF